MCLCASQPSESACVCVRVCVCEQTDLSCLKEMAWKASNDLPLCYGADLSLLSVRRPCFLFFCILKFFFPFSCRGLASVSAGGRGVVVGPILSQTLPDVFCDNEYGPNFLFRNNGDGTFTDVAQQAGESPTSLPRSSPEVGCDAEDVPAGLEDPMQHGRGVALADFNRDGRTDIVYGNWNGPHRLFVQLNNRKQKFKVGLEGLPRIQRDLTNRSVFCPAGALGFIW